MTMEHVFNVSVRKRIAKYKGREEYICGNSGYIIRFDFDDEWADYDIKTARIVTENGTYDVLFEGNECKLPILSDTWQIGVGVYAGNLRTSTKAYIPAKKSILCGSGTPSAPPEDVYAQIMEKVNDAVETAEDVQSRADAGEFDGDPGVVISDTEPTDPDVQVWIDPSGDADQLVTAKDITGALGYTPAKQEDVASLYEDKADKEKPYELIETITLEEESKIERTQEPDGTPYYFKSVLVKGFLYEDSGSGNDTRYFCNDATVGYAWWSGKTNVTKRHQRLDEIKQDKGYWSSQWCDWKTSDDGAMSRYLSTFSMRHSIKEYPAITRISVRQTLPAGTEIQIWGVRA